MLTRQLVTQEPVTVSPSYSFDHDAWTEFGDMPLECILVSPFLLSRRNHNEYEIEPLPDTPMQVPDTPMQVPDTPMHVLDTPMQAPDTTMQTPQRVTYEPEGDYYFNHHAQLDPPTPKFETRPPVAWAVSPNGNAAPPPPSCYPGYGFPYYPPGQGFPPPFYAGYFLSIPGCTCGLSIAMPYTDAQASEERLPMKRSEGVTPLDNDVLCGKGLTRSTHIGTVQFRALLAETKCQYAAAQTGEKTVIARKIVNIIRSRGGRFLLKDAFGSWQQVDDEKAIIKKVVYLFTGI